MTWLDWAIVVVYLGGIVWLGARYARRQSDTAEYFLGGRQMPLWAVTLSVIAAEVSAATFLGLPEQGYDANLSYLTLSVGFILGRLILALFFLGRFRQLELYTVYGFLEQRFGAPTKNAAAGVFLVARLLASGVRLFFPAIAIFIITDKLVGLTTSVVIMGVLGLVYTFLGGIRGVIWTEVVQAITFIGGGIALVTAIVWQTDESLPNLIALCADHEKFRVVQTGGSILEQPYHVVTALVGSTVLALASHGTDQDMCQRMLTCKTNLASRLSVFYSGLIGLPVSLLFLLVGVALFAFVQVNGPVVGATQPSEFLPAFVRGHLGTGCSGLMLAALAAAALSTHASSIASLSSTTIVDFYRPYIRPGASEAHYVRVSRGVSIFWGLALIGVALAAARLHAREDASIIGLALGAMSLVYGPLLGVFLLGIFTPFGRNGTNLVGMLVAFVVVLCISLEVVPVRVAWPWWVVIGTTITVAIGLLGGRTRRSPA